MLVSETLLQQTQIARGGPAWVRFTGEFPTVESLAAATPAAVLRAWQGLGYNRRAINLKRTARIVVTELGGAFPRDVAGLERLPGIGPYTARAVASIAFRIATGAVDTNVRRVLGRVLAGDPADLAPSRLQAAADRLVDPDQPDDWTHALMDIGATLCRPARPSCAECPVESFCRYAAGERPMPARAGRNRAAQAGQGRPQVAGRSHAPRTGRSRAPRPAWSDFAATTRWLRGRILDRLRAAPADDWVTFSGEIGSHDPAAVRRSLEALARDSLLELDAGPENPRARLPIA